MPKTNQAYYSSKQNKFETNFPKLVCMILFIWGMLSVVLSIIIGSTTLGFIGLGLTFWGSLLLYVTNEKFVKKNLLTASLIPPLKELNKLITELNYKGKAVYLPPGYLKEFDDCKLFVPKNIDIELNSLKNIRENPDHILINEPKGLLLNPHGSALITIFEKKMEKSFTNVDLKILQKSLPKLIEDLELANSFEIEEIEPDYTNGVSSFSTGPRLKFTKIKVKIIDSVYHEIYQEIIEFSYFKNFLGCPLISSIACSLAKASGKPIIIDKIRISDEEKNIEAIFTICDPLPTVRDQKEITLKQYEAPLASIFSRYSIPKYSFMLIIIGLINLILVAYITYLDITVWGKDLVFIFLNSRIGESISLGIGMKIIHYLILGIGFLFSGLILIKKSW